MRDQILRNYNPLAEIYLTRRRVLTRTFALPTLVCSLQAFSECSPYFKRVNQPEGSRAGVPMIGSLDGLRRARQAKYYTASATRMAAILAAVYHCQRWSSLET
eukprot:scaffold420722_cov18-Prasinocladus_malaysianus.AAC.1